jgi:hypothetical protein
MAFPSLRVTLERALATGALLCVGVGTAGAQGIASPSSLNPMQGSAPSFAGEQLDRSLRAQPRPPAALPGAAPKAQAIAPPTQVPALMSPTSELFDAINRGDMANVRDALSRGAELSATNELGLTPLDLSIDLGRNDISFLLLSMRGAGSSQPIQAAQAAKPAEPAAPDRTKAVRRAQRERPRTVMHAADAEPAGQPSLPTLFAGNGGAPVPRAGFLGFGR